jgi:hypothetical protein
MFALNPLSISLGSSSSYISSTQLLCTQNLQKAYQPAYQAYTQTRYRRKRSKGSATAYLLQGQTAKKVTVISPCSKAQKDKTLITSCNV